MRRERGRTKHLRRMAGPLGAPEGQITKETVGR